MSNKLSESTIAESQYIFDNKALQLAERFFNIPDTSLLKVGTFGYNVALASHMMRDSTFHRNMLYNEFFLSNASLNSTLYNWAKILDYKIELSTPAQMTAIISVNLSQLQRISTPSLLNSNNLEYTINRDTIFDVGGHTFMLPYAVRLNVLKANTSGQFNVTAIYDFTSYNYKPLSIKTPYIKSTLHMEQGNLHVAFPVTIYQMRRNDYVYTITSNDILDIGIIEQNYGKNMVDFQVEYNDNSTGSSTYLPMETIFNENNLPETDKWLYYTYVGQDTLRMYFSNRPNGFRPKFNSKLKLTTFTTEGESGNFQYSGNIYIRDPVLESINYNCVPATKGSTGGASLKSFNDTKLALIQKLRTRNNISTVYDLQTYFNEVKKTSFASNSDFRVVKTRDDIIRRQFSMYILSRNLDGKLTPTNTINMEFTIQELERLGYSLNAGTMVLYDRIENRYRLLEENELPEVYMNSSDQYIYCIPFLMNVDFKLFPKTNLFLTNYSRTMDVTYDYVNVNTNSEIIINALTLSRNPMFDIDKFNLSVNIATNAIHFENIKLRSVLIKNEVPIGYADLRRIEGTSEYILEIDASDEFDKDGKYKVRNTFREIETNAIIPELLLDGGYTIRLGVFVESSLSNNPKRGIFQNMNNLDNFIHVSTITGTEEVSFAEDLSNIMYCQTFFNDVRGTIEVRNIPVVGALSFLNKEQNLNIMNDIQQSIMIAKNISKNLENNTSIDIKFYNTYGKSKYFDIDTIDLKLKMVLSINVSVSKQLEDEIKAFIVEYIESCNNTIDKRFSFSNLTRLLETNFTQIKYIKFFTINGGNIQSIKQIYHLNTNLDEFPLDYVPEFLNVKKLLPNINSSSWFEPAIEILYEN